MIEKRTLITCLALAQLFVGQAWAQSNTETAAQEIERTVQRYIAAFNQGDAKALAEFWTATGEYVGSDGERFEGRDAIEKQYATFFAANSGAQLHIKTDSIRLVDADTAIQDGRSVIGEDPKKSLSYNRFTAILVLDQGQWLLASVRSTTETIPMRERMMGYLDWLVGTWGADEGDVQVRTQCRWIANKQFLERTFAVREAGKNTASGTQIIGWDPAVQALTSWLFDSSGAHSRGIWVPVESGWRIDTAGMTQDGTPTGAENHIRRVDENSISWKSVKRTLGDAALPDLEEIVLKRYQD